MRILIADDEAVHLRLLQLTLRHWGYEVTTAVDGLAAWESLQKDGAPDLVIADWDMPGIDGFELARRIREDPALSATPVLIITVMASSVSAHDRFSHVNDYLVKPWNPRDLQASIHKLIGEQ
jgi:CheY-like chemotaxis protein